MFSLFRRRTPASPPLRVRPGMKGFVRVEEIDFFGQFSTSRSGKFLIAWSDADSTGSRGGYRDSGHGRFLLAKDEVVIAQGKAERPNDGRVSDVGTFVFNDWMFGDGLRGTFLAFSETATPLISHSFSANLYNNGISEDGRYAVCQTCASETNDGNVLAMFDIANKSILWKDTPPPGWAAGYSFDIPERRLVLHYKDRGDFAYGFDGQFLDHERWASARVDFMSPYELHALARSMLSGIDSVPDRTATLKEISVLAHKALTRTPNAAPRELAQICRTLGEVQELLGDTANALQAYDRALLFDPKVGLKRRVAALRARDA